MTVLRPALRWHGGKWLLAPWVIQHLPPHRIYVEPFGGAASVLLRKPPSYAEVYNDLDRDVVNLFRVLRCNAQSAELQRRLRLTPFARAEFEEAYKIGRDPVDRARRLIIRSFMGFGSDGATGAYRTGFRSNSNRSGTTPAHDWVNYAEALPDLTARLAGVVIECRPAVEVLRQQDSSDTLHYLDPPYVHSTRMRRVRASSGGVYRHEMSDHDHAALLGVVRDLRGMVVISGYANPLYDAALADWQRVERSSLADDARPRTEVLWINDAASRRLGVQGELALHPEDSFGNGVPMAVAHG